MSCLWATWSLQLLFAVVLMFWIGRRLPRSVLVIDALLCFVATALVRFSVRIRNEGFSRDRFVKDRKGIIIYGAGAAGAELLHEIHSKRRTRYEVFGFLDDDPLKQDALILGIPVLGVGRHASSVVHRLNRCKRAVEEIIIAMPSATGRQMREVLGQLPRRGDPLQDGPQHRRTARRKSIDFAVAQLVGT